MQICTIDRYIKSGETIELTDKYGDTFRAILVSRKGRHFETMDGGLFDRTDIVKAVPKGY